MFTLLRFKAPKSRCHYLSDQTWQLEYEIVAKMSQQEYQQRLDSGWRKFGAALFRPQCPSCVACQPIRILVSQFKPDRNQRRVAKANGTTRLEIGTASKTPEKVSLYMRHHQHHAEQKGWPEPHSDSIFDTFQEGPIEIQEWRYFRDDKLTAVSYIDPLPQGLSGVYFFYDPDYRDLSPGTWIVLSLIEEAKRQNLPYVYLGYYVENCRSMEYKKRFKPHEILVPGSGWQLADG